MNTFKVGVSEVDITPVLGTSINGDFVSHYASYIHDSLKSKSIVFHTNDTEIAVVIVDICYMKRDFLDVVKKDINKETGIDLSNIMISSTHTHGGGAIDGGLLSAPDIHYRQKLHNAIVMSVVNAKGILKEAKIAFGKVSVPEHVVNRRYIMKSGYNAVNPITGAIDKIKTNPSGSEGQIEKRNGTTDNDVSYIAIKDLNDNWLGMLANYSLHYVGDWDMGTITSDYYGVFAQRIKSKLNANNDFVAIMSNGTSGDVNIIDFLNPERYPKEKFKKSLLIGQDIADKVVSSMEDLKWEVELKISCNMRNLKIPVHRPSKEILEKAKETLTRNPIEEQTAHSGDTGTSHTGNDRLLVTIFAREQIRLNEYYKGDYSLPIQVIKIGNTTFGCLGGEFFAETGLTLKKECGIANYFTIGLANDYTGYVPPMHEFKMGGYETWRTSNSILPENAESIIKDELLRMIAEINA